MTSMTPAEMMDEYFKVLAEQEEVKRVGYRINDVCWHCKQVFPRLRYKICDNGYISYWCDKCY